MFNLCYDLKSKRYKHSSYTGFYIYDPKVRHVHKATVRDRILHHAVFRALNPLYDKTFIDNSFSCRVGKGTHKGVLTVEKMIRAESRNYTRPCFVLKCDVSKFFSSIDHRILVNILKERIADKDTMWLLENIIESFSTGYTNLFDRHGLPIGNLTSQLFANIYMNEFDIFMKHKLRIFNYARYTDDFIIVSINREYLKEILIPIQEFLNTNLKLSLHPNKISICVCHRGVDFLGYTILPHYKLLRTKTKRRMFRKLKERTNLFKQGKLSEDSFNQSLQSYLGVLSHANTYKLSQDLKNQYWFWLHE
ncbi:MAG: reverse transcriptase/maturase family protein [Patescibacteria group bacterium]|nr:reverse transcriptase/maturase family protein [Patescibacteria group bacterium]